MFSDDAPYALSCIASSRKIDEKLNAEKQRAQQLSTSFEEQVLPQFLGHLVSFYFFIPSFYLIYFNKYILSHICSR